MDIRTDRKRELLHDQWTESVFSPIQTQITRSVDEINTQELQVLPLPSPPLSHLPLLCLSVTHALLDPAPLHTCPHFASISTLLDGHQLGQLGVS